MENNLIYASPEFIQQLIDATEAFRIRIAKDAEDLKAAFAHLDKTFQSHDAHLYRRENQRNAGALERLAPTLQTLTSNLTTLRDHLRVLSEEG